jgi:hypothetical protein
MSSNTNNINIITHHPFWLLPRSPLTNTTSTAAYLHHTLALIQQASRLWHYSRSRRSKQLRASRIRQQAHATSEQSRKCCYKTQPPIWRMHLVQNDNSADEQESGEEGAEPRYEGANGSVRSVGDAGFGALSVLTFFLSVFPITSPPQAHGCLHEVDDSLERKPPAAHARSSTIDLMSPAPSRLPNHRYHRIDQRCCRQA